MSTDLTPAEIVRQNAAFVWRTLRFHGVPEASLEDASQEVFLVVTRNLHKFEGRSSLQTWIFGVCRFTALHMRRTRARRPELITDAPPDVGIAETQSQDLSRRHALETLQRALATVPEANRMVFVLFEIEHMPMEEVARTVGCVLNTAYTRLYAARKQLQRALTDMGAADDVYHEIAEAL